LVAAGNESTVDMAIEQWRGRLRACVSVKGGHFEHSLNLLMVLILSTIYHFCVTVLFKYSIAE